MPVDTGDSEEHLGFMLFLDNLLKKKTEIRRVLRNIVKWDYKEMLRAIFLAIFLIKIWFGFDNYFDHNHMK